MNSIFALVSFSSVTLFVSLSAALGLYILGSPELENVTLRHPTISRLVAVFIKHISETSFKIINAKNGTLLVVVLRVVMVVE